MRFAIVGESRTLSVLADEVAAHDLHEIVAEFSLQQVPDQAWVEAKLNRRHDSWESLLHGTLADAVILGAGDNAELFAECLRKLSQAAVPTWVVHPAGTSILGYEIEMILQDSTGVVVPYIPLAHHPAISYLKELALSSSTTEQGIVRLQMSRPLSESDPKTVRQQFSQDIHLIRMLVGEIDKVAAMNSGDSPQSYDNLSVQMHAAEDTIATWTVSPFDNRAVTRIETITRDRTFCLSLPSDVTRWEIVDSVGNTVWHAAEDTHLVTDALDRFVSQVQGRRSLPNWVDACRNLEITEVIADSLRRRRTIDLLYEEHSEETTFMGIMSMGGCAILLLGTLFLIVAGIIDGLQLPLREHLLFRLWPVYLATLLATFLFLQTLRFVFPTTARNTKDDASQVNPANFNG